MRDGPLKRRGHGTALKREQGKRQEKNLEKKPHKQLTGIGNKSTVLSAPLRTLTFSASHQREEEEEEEEKQPTTSMK